MSALAAFVSRCQEQAELAFPAMRLLQPEKAPTLLESAPYVLDRVSFRDRYGLSERRQAMITELFEHVQAMEAAGALVATILVGGSFIDLDREPRDLDCLALYSIVGTAGSEQLESLLAVGKQGAIDVRHLPADSDPILLLKAVLFFSELYCRRDPNGSHRRSLLLIKL